MSHIGENIRNIRALLGMTQKELGERLGVTKQAVSKMEISAKMNNDKINRIATALGVTSEGLRSLDDKNVLINSYNPRNRVAKYSFTNSLDTPENVLIEEITIFYEHLLQLEKEKFDRLKKNHIMDNI